MPPSLASVQQLVNGGESASKYSAGLSMAFRPFLQTPYNFNVMLNKSFIERQIHGTKNMCDIGNREMVDPTTDSTDSNLHARSPSLNEHSPAEPISSPGQDQNAEELLHEPTGQPMTTWSPMVEVKQEHSQTDENVEEKRTSLTPDGCAIDQSKKLSQNQTYEQTSFYSMAKQESAEAIK